MSKANRSKSSTRIRTWAREKNLPFTRFLPIMKFMAEDMLESMDDAGVDGVVTFAIGIGEPSDYRETNQYISNAMKQHAGRIHGFMRLSPGNGPKDTLQVLEEGVKLGTQRDQDSSADRALPSQ